MLATSIGGLTALDVVENIGKGKKRDITKTAIKHGASEVYAGSGQVQNTREYKEVMQTALDKMIAERERIQLAMQDKDLSKERYETLTRSLTTMTHDIQLLSGGKTENVSVEEDRRLLIGIVAQLRSADNEDISHRIEE